MYVCALLERRSPAYPTYCIHVPTLGTLLYGHDLVWGVFTGALAHL